MQLILLSQNLLQPYDIVPTVNEMDVSRHPSENVDSFHPETPDGN